MKNDKTHFLLCEKHKDETENKQLLEKYKERFILKCETPLPLFSKTLSCFSKMVGLNTVNVSNYNDR